MKLIFFFLVLFALCCCSTKSNKNASVPLIKAISIIDTFPLLSNDGRNVIFYPPEEKKVIYFYKDYKLYRISLYHTLDSVRFVNDSLIESIPYKKDTTYFYYARKGEDNLVYRIDSITDVNFKKMSADSLYRSNSMYETPSFDQTKLHQYAKKMATYENDKFIIDKYVAPIDHPEGVYDTCYHFFSKETFWKNIPFNISTPTDSLNKLKLVKIKLIFNKNPASKEMASRQGFKISSEMREEKITNNIALLSLFERFEKLVK
jgi:hypothetical protein